MWLHVIFLIAWIYATESHSNWRLGLKSCHIFTFLLYYNFINVQQQCHIHVFYKIATTNIIPALGYHQWQYGTLHTCAIRPYPPHTCAWLPLIFLPFDPLLLQQEACRMPVHTYVQASSNDYCVVPSLLALRCTEKVLLAILFTLRTSRCFESYDVTALICFEWNKIANILQIRTKF